MNTATKPQDAEAGPTDGSITIVIPTRQRRDQVIATLTTLVEQAGDIREVIEAVLVVDGSLDGTAQALHALELAVQLTVIEQDQAGVAAARNRGASVATCEWILFLDDDIVVQPGYLRAVIDGAGNDVDIVLTRLRVGDWVTDSLLSREAHGWDNDEHAALEQGRRRYDDLNFPATLIRRHVFETAGGFDESFTRDGVYGNEDVELGHRLLKAGARVCYCAEAIARTGVVDDTDLILRRFHQVGKNDIALVRKHPELGPVRFGNRFRHSKIDRVLAPIMLRLPISFAALTPFRAIARWLMRRGSKGKAAHRIWLSIRAVHYWRGVADAGGRVIVARARRAATVGASHSTGPLTATPASTRNLGELCSPGTMERSTLADVTLIIPTLGRESLVGCLDAVASGTAWPGELLVMDQGAEPATDEWMRDIEARGLRARHVRSQERGTAVAMNRSLDLVGTKFVAVTHDDCLVDADWLRLLTDRLRAEGDAIITGQVKPEPGMIVPGTITSPDAARYHRPLVDRDPLFPDNMGFPLAVARRLGPFDEDDRARFAEDAEWSYRALRSGIPIVYAPELAVTHLGWRDEAQRSATYRNYARSQGVFYGKYLRRGDRFIALRTIFDLARGPWMWLRGTVQRDPGLAAYGRAYMTALPAGVVGGLRRP